MVLKMFDRQKTDRLEYVHLEDETWSAGVPEEVDQVPFSKPLLTSVCLNGHGILHVWPVSVSSLVAW